MFRLESKASIYLVGEQLRSFVSVASYKTDVEKDPRRGESCERGCPEGFTVPTMSQPGRLRQTSFSRIQQENWAMSAGRLLSFARSNAVPPPSLQNYDSALIKLTRRCLIAMTYPRHASLHISVENSV
jgi:hypothetical protein